VHSPSDPPRTAEDWRDRVDDAFYEAFFGGDSTHVRQGQRSSSDTETLLNMAVGMIEHLLTDLGRGPNTTTRVPAEEFVEHVTTIALEVRAELARRGGIVTVTAPMRIQCPDCSGSGARKVPCGQCHGQGTTSMRQGAHTLRVRCSLCLGLKSCPGCTGSGTAVYDAAAKVRIPPGVRTGTTLRVPTSEDGRSYVRLVITVI
jgi:DnaJ-class molecular chaperone